MEFLHIKLERHDVVYAERAPADTLLNVDEYAVNLDASGSCATRLYNLNRDLAMGET